jgi:hypothetical protein
MTDLTNEQLLKELKGIRRVVINDCYGGFGLSDEAEALYRELAGVDVEDDKFHVSDIARDDPLLIKVIRELGPAADGLHAELKIIEIPADVEWQIGEYDGNEWVAEKHRTWS